MAATINVTGKFTGYTHTLTVDLDSQDSIENTTTVSYSYVVHREVASAHGSIVTDNSVAFHAILNGVDNVGTPNFNFATTKDVEVVAGSQTLNNNPDGTLSFTVKFSTLGKTGSSYLKPATKTATFIVDPVDRSSDIVISPQPIVPGDTFTVDITAIDPSFTHNVYITNSSDVTTTVATGVATQATGTAPALGAGLDEDAASIQVDTIVGGVVIGSTVQDLLIWSNPADPDISLNTPFDFRFRHVKLNGSLLEEYDVIPYLEANFTDTYSDTATCSIKTSQLLYAADLDKALVLAEVFNGSSWVNTGLLFTLTRIEDDAANVEGTTTYSGTSYVDFILSKGTTLHKSKHHSATPGELIQAHLDKAQDRKWGPRIAWSFTNSRSSANTRWAVSSMSLDLEAGTPFLQILQGMVSESSVEYRTAFRNGKAVLRLYNSGYGYDWTVSKSKTQVNFDTQGVARVVTAAPFQKDYSGMLTRVTATGKTTNKKIKVRNPKTGRLNTETKSSTLTRTKTRADLVNPLYGELEAHVDASGISSSKKLTRVADDVIISGNRPVISRQFTYQVDSQDISPALYPYRVFKPGDWVLVPDEHGSISRARVSQLLVSRDSDAITVQVTTGDLIPTGPAAIYRYLHRSRNGAIPGGVLTATPKDAGTISPKSVTTLAATPVGQFDTTGIARANIALTWDEVTSDEDDNDLQVSSYQILTRPTFEDPWNVVATSDSPSIVLPNNFAPWTTMDVAVVPIADDGTIGDPDDFITLTTPEPASLLGVPTAPSLNSDAIGNVAVQWDGLLSGVLPPQEFSYVRTEISATGSGGWSVAGGQLSAAGTTVVQDVGAGVWYFRFVTVDTLGRDGTTSGTSNVTVAPIVADTREPLAPTGLNVTSVGTWSGSAPTASVTAAWTAVTEDTSYNPIDIFAYELWGKPQSEDVFTFLTSVEGTETSVTYNDIGPLGSAWDFEVRATAVNGVQSAFSYPDNATIAIPALALDPPTQPDLTTFRGLALVSWDGNLVDSLGVAYAAPAYLSNVDIWVSVDGGATYTRQGFLTAGTRTQSVAGLGVGSTVSIALVAVDRLGQATAASVPATIAIAGIDGADLIANTVNANTLIAGTLNVDKVSPSFGNDLDITANDTVSIIAGNLDVVKTTAKDAAASVAAMRTRYDFTPTAAVISSPGNAFSVSISNTQMDFLDGGISRAYLNAGIFNAPKFASSEIALPKHVIMDDPSGVGTIIKRF